MNKIYHISNGKKLLGYYKLGELNRLELKDTFKVWTEGNNDWKNILEYEELKPLVVRTPPPINKGKSYSSIPNRISVKKHAKNIKEAVLLFVFITLAIFIYMGGLAEDSYIINKNNNAEEKVYFQNTSELRIIILYSSVIVSTIITAILYTLEYAFSIITVVKHNLKEIISDLS